MDLKKEVERLNALLKLERKIIGVKIVANKEEYDEFSGKELTSPISYCTAVKTAMNGIPIKMEKSKCSCSGSTRALGFEKAGDDYYSGQGACDLGLFTDKYISSGVSHKVKMLPEGNFGVILKPLESFESIPDIAMIVTDTYNMMRLIQGYTCMFGIEENFSMTGNQAICIECTSNPIIRNDINISMLCSGTRFYAKWKDYECGIGIPIDKLHNVIEGVRRTVNAVEMDNRKKIIIENLNALGEDTRDLQLDHTYYLEIERRRQNNG